MMDDGPMWELLFAHGFFWVYAGAIGVAGTFGHVRVLLGVQVLLGTFGYFWARMDTFGHAGTFGRVRVLLRRCGYWR